MERYLYEYAYVHRDFEAVCALLEREPQRVLEPATRLAAKRTDEMVTDLHFELGGFEVGRAARLEIVRFDRHRDRAARLSFRWAATQGALFPEMDADLEVHPLSAGSRPLCQLAFVGHYRPPLWLVGAAIDAMVGRRVAASVVEHFIEEVKFRIERELSPLGLDRSLTPAAVQAQDDVEGAPLPSHE